MKASMCTEKSDSYVRLKLKSIRRTHDIGLGDDGNILVFSSDGGYLSVLLDEREWKMLRDFMKEEVGKDDNDDTAD